MENQLITCERCGTTNRVSCEKLARGLNAVCGRCKSPLSNGSARKSALDNGQSAAPKLSPEFLAGGTEAGLDKIRTRLLDLTNRNRLLNFRHTVTSSLRAAETAIDSRFQCLLDGQKLNFIPVPEPAGYFESGDQEGSITRTKPVAAEYAKTLGWPDSYELELNELPVFHYVQELEARTRQIGSAAKTAIEESGTNMLYMIFGFLEWYEADDSQVPHLAPLLTLPVSLERSSGKGKGFECTVEYSGEDFTTNLSLVEKMRRDFGVDIPLVEDDDTPEKYFARFCLLLKQKPRWRIRSHITLSLLSFGKLLMYRDLDPRAWPGIVAHSLVKELFEGRKSDSITHASEYAIDAPEIQLSVPPVILDADSSQHSALIDAVQGRNVVIEGPPGTGKSQTITNLIAAALVRGKTVLFVSEKLAALEVVRRRLDGAGLGQFCLELHSHKTKKHALLNDIGTRLKAQGSFRDSRDLDQHQSAVEERKRLLTQHVGLMNKAIHPYQSTIFEVLWARDRYYQELPFARESVEHVLVPAMSQFTRAQFGEALQFLSIYGTHLTNLKQVVSSVADHPWSWVQKSLSFDEEVRLLELLAAFLSKLQAGIELLRSLSQNVGLELEDSIVGLGKMRDYISQLPATVGGIIPSLLRPCQDSRARAALRVFIKEIELVRSSDAVLRAATVADNAECLLREENRKRLAGAIEGLQTLGLEHISAAEAQILLDRVRGAQDMLADASTCFAELQALVGSKLAFNVDHVDLVLRCVRLIENAPGDALHLRASKLEDESVRALLHEAAEECQVLRQKHIELDVLFDLALAQEIADARQLREHAIAIEEAAFWEIWFGRVYRRAVNVHRRISRKGTKSTRRQVSGDLRVIASYFHRRAQFEDQHSYREALGHHFRGMGTHWDAVIALTEWYSEIFVSLPDQARDLHDILFRERTERLKGMKAELHTFTSHRETLAQLAQKLASVTASLPLPISSAQSLEELNGILQSVAAQLSELISAFADACLREQIPAGSIPALLKTSDEYHERINRLLVNEEFRRLLGPLFAGAATEIAPVKATLDFAEAVALSDLAESIKRQILCNEYPQCLEKIRSQFAEADALGSTLVDTSMEIRTLAATAWPPPEGEGLPSCLHRANRALEYREELPRWCHFVRMRGTARDQGLDPLTKLAEDGSIEPAHLVPAFRFVFYNTLARSIVAGHPEMSEFSGLTQDLVRKQFAEADRMAIALFRERAASIIDRRPVPAGNGRGPVREWTDLALITNEINKQKRHIPIRQLVRRAGSALQALKPCFMMGPLSVAQYLAPGEIHFDLIVMDEASQLKPEDAIGAIARGAQIVIVGDPKQLPPTNFFQRVSLDSDDQEDEKLLTVVEEGESILDVASTLYQPVRRLRWHYRSRHHSLIAFSNREFYQGDLVIFPSSLREDVSLGVKYRTVADGVCENSRNPREAALVVKAVLDHMQKHPDESLGVVAMNFEQRELIEELLDRELRTDPFALAYQERMTAGPEPFFVKNLENVQGDERDVIFISVTYGPDSRGNQYMRFGPVNSTNGHRRLNVLFTRAKKRIEVFSSLDPDKIQVNASSAWGLRAFKQYLTFARTGVLQTPEVGGRESETDFERAVGTVLKERGYAVDVQVGVAGFFIDLAVQHPAKPGAYVLGIECDGASYHSGRSARDRDRLRQEILENLGWRIHRIWSTDWFKSRSNEVKRLLGRIEELLAHDPDYQREKQKARLVEILHQRLIELHDNEIRPAFPDCDPATSLLRPPLLDEFVRRKPRSRDDWFRSIAPELRSGTDPKQVGRFLPRVLDIINEVMEI
jgi:very-short-patch-repair endonuclease